MNVAGRACVLLAFSCLLPFPIFAVEWDPIPQEDLAMTSIKEQPGAPAVVLIRQETDDDMNNFHMVYQRIKVLTDAGREYANVELPYSRRGFSVSAVSGRTVHADGTVIPFEGKPFDKTVVHGNGLQVNVKSFTLPDVQVGSIIDYKYSLRYDDNMVLPPEWVVQTELFQRKAYFKFIPFQNHGNVEIMLHHDQISRGIAWAPFLGNSPQPQIHTVPVSSFATVHDVGFWVDLSLANLPPIVAEPYMPPSNLLKMRVYFYYQAAMNQADYWKTEGKFWNKDVEGFLGRNRGIDEQVAKLLSPADTPEQKVRKIYAFVTTLENQDYIPARSTQEQKALELRNNKGAEDVLQNRSGRHDDLNRLFVAMVRAAGVPAAMIWVPDRSEEVFIKELLSTRQFDAEVAVVSLDGKDVFLDPGSKFCPYGTVDWRYSAVDGLKQDQKGAIIAAVAPPNYKNAATTRVADLQLDEHGMASGTVALSFRGMTAMLRRQEGEKTDETGRKKLLEDELRGMLPGNSEITLLNSPDWNSTEAPLTAQFHVSCPYAVAAGKRLMIMQHFFQTNERSRFPSAQRANAVYFHFPWEETDEVHIKIPAGMSVESLAPDDMQKVDYAVYQVRQKQEAPDKIFSRRDFIMAGMVITSDKYQALKSFFDKVKNDDDQPALVRISSNVASASQ
jgi:hypothetical protein